MLAVFNGVSAQKKTAELTVVYDYRLSASDADKKAHGDENTFTSTIYIKGNLSRSEQSNSLYSSATIYDANTNTGVLLKEVSGQKLLIRISQSNWQEMNAASDGIVFTKTAETKSIAGYKCIKATGKSKDGTLYTVYYTPEINPENKNYNLKFKDLDGLPLEYEMTLGSSTIRYLVSRINMNPVPASKFDIPKTGYRELTYEESKKLKNGK